MSKIRVGIVVSNKMDKTAIVRVDRMVPHSKYGKRYRVSTRFAAHDPNNTAEIGQTVTIKEVAPISKTKTWMIVSPETEDTTKNISETTVEAKPVKKATRKTTKEKSPTAKASEDK